MNGNQNTLAARIAKSGYGLKGLPREWRVGIVLLTLASIFISGIFDSLIISVLGYREVDRSIRIAVAVLLASLVAYVGVAAVSGKVPPEYLRREKPVYEIPLRWLIGLAPVWTLIGLVNGWPITYVLGDIYLILAMPVTYFLLIRRPLTEPWRVFNWLYMLLMVMAIFSTIIVIQHNIIEKHRDKLGVDAVLAPLLYTLLKTHPNPLEILISAVFIIAAVVSSKRGTWLGLLMVISMSLFLRPGVRRPLRILLIGVAIYSIINLVRDNRPEWISQGTDLVQRRLLETREDLGGERGDLSVTSGGRASEIIGVFDTYASRANPIDWVTGLGLGAIIQTRNGRLRHHVHSTPAVFLARTGPLGLALWTFFMFAVLVRFIRFYFRKKAEWFQVQCCFWLALWISAMVLSLKSQAFWGNVVGGIQLAYLYHMMRAADQKDVISPPAAVPARACRRVPKRLQRVLKRRISA